MCGICGFNHENKSLLKKMCDSIIYRGPDEVGYYTNSGVSLGIRRLSIIDLQTGSQPQHNEDEDIWIVFNGEIYNFLKLRIHLEENGHIFYTASDTEVIIHAYEEWGENCLNKLRGQFAFCIYDLRKQIFFLARDPLGLKPLYYYFDGDKFIFSSEIKCILFHDIKRKIDKRALSLYLSLKYVPHPQTLFKSIYKILPSSYLKFDLRNKRIDIKKYWDINFNINWEKNENQFSNELKRLIEESVKIRLISEVPLGVFLSGGIDSSSIVGIMNKFMDEPVKTFSIGFEEGASEDETIYSRFVADYYKTDHTEFTVKSSSYKVLPKLIWHFDDLIADPAIIPVYFLAKLAKEKVTVVLTGDGADEVFAGYSIYHNYFKKDIGSYIPNQFFSLIKKFKNIIPSPQLWSILSYLSLSKTEENRYLRGILGVKNFEKDQIFPFKTENLELFLKEKFIKNIDVINKMIYWDLKYQLPNQYNVKADRAISAASVEPRIPFLDKKIVELASTIPSQLKLNGTTEKYILRLAMKDILPPQILKRKKLGFGIPVKMWLKTGMKEISIDILERLEKRKSLINPIYIKKIKKNRSKWPYKKIVWNLIMFELWYETFIENKIIKPISF